VVQRIHDDQQAHHARLGGARHVHGPVSDQPGPVAARAHILTTGSPAQSRQLAEGALAVGAGRLTVEIMTWQCPAATTNMPGGMNRCRESGNPSGVFR